MIVRYPDLLPPWRLKRGSGWQVMRKCFGIAARLISTAQASAYGVTEKTISQ